MLEFLTKKITVGDVVRIWTPIIIIGIGVSALVGWWFELDLLIRYFNDHVSIKPYTAVAAIVAGFIITTKGTAKKWLSIVMLVLMGKLILDYIEVICFGAPTQEHDQVETVYYNFPSWATILMYTVMVYCTQCKDCATRGGRIITAISGIAMVGHIFDCSVLYWYLPEYSTGMAAPTAIIGVHVGTWMTHGFNDTIVHIETLFDRTENAATA